MVRGAKTATVALGLGWLAAAGVAGAAEGDRQSARIALTTTEPGAPTGNTTEVDWRNPADPQGKPYSVATVVIKLHPGAVVDTSALPQCKASDAELLARGSEACPATSRVGSGKIVSDTGSTAVFPRFVENEVSTFNNESELIGVSESTTVPPVPGVGRVVSRTRISGNTFTFDVPAFPGNPPPDSYTALKSMRLTTPPIVRAGRAYALTPPSCPDSGQWTGSITFIYRDGVSQTVTSSAPCRVGTTAAPACLARRAPIGPRNIGRIRLRATRARLLRLPVAAPRRRSHSLSWCVKRSPGRVIAVFGSRGRAELVVTTAADHRNRGVQPGGRAGILGRAYPRRRHLGGGLYRANRRSPRLIGVRRGRVRFWAVASIRLLTSPRELRRALRRAGL